MLYDIRLGLHYDYPSPVEGGRHHVRALPRSLPGLQQVITATVEANPAPTERTSFVDFFGNRVESLIYRSPHDTLDVTMTARVEVTRTRPAEDRSPPRDALRSELGGSSALGGESPLHFLASSHHAPETAEITGYAASGLNPDMGVYAFARALTDRIHDEFAYDPDATTVGTLAPEAFRLKAGVCQDFSHIMIAGLRGLGIPAGYVSGFIRTIPPPGQERLEGVDAMHAWVRVWCGGAMGWQEFDPTNAMPAGPDHIVVGYGRDYADVAPIVGVLRTIGRHSAEQSVDVIPVVQD